MECEYLELFGFRVKLFNNILYPTLRMTSYRLHITVNVNYALYIIRSMTTRLTHKVVSLWRILYNVITYLSFSFIFLADLLFGILPESLLGKVLRRDLREILYTPTPLWSREIPNVFNFLSADYSHFFIPRSHWDFEIILVARWSSPSDLPALSGR